MLKSSGLSVTNKKGERISIPKAVKILEACKEPKSKNELTNIVNGDEVTKIYMPSLTDSGMLELVRESKFYSRKHNYGRHRTTGIGLEFLENYKKFMNYANSVFGSLVDRNE